ncbi:MAG TPA: hypothetical protein VNH22_06085 [Blastocatellia bacterium]|jgi:photosystem II stability/assembly factor-like uncharacterized protein|nr:hypothetical protein [Blastocatellia bacterium]
MRPILLSLWDRSRLRISLFLTFTILSACVHATAQGNGRMDEAALKNLQWRSIGPANMGGRIDDFAVVESNPRIIYVGTATGGVWKTTNNGTTWAPVFDEAGSPSIGDVTLAPSDPNIVWVGTGEANNRQSSSWGDGVYRSLDAGKTWQNMGLKDSRHIGRIVIDPNDANVVYVAAAGHLWGPNKERGLFKTTDGGKTWANVLFINEDTGVIDVSMDPKDPRILYAAAYQRRRTPFGFNGGGPHSALYKTTDGGANWTRLTSGLPQGNTGRIGIDIYRANPNIVYAVVEHEKGGTFRSEDRGATWKQVSNTNPRPMYYSNIRIDPTSDQRIWILGAPMFTSEDGGKSFSTGVVTRIHGDFHAMWINPADSNHMILGSDGGIHISYDRGRAWDFVNTIPLGQFYEVALDNRKPYWVYGGLQDNGSWAGPSGTLNQEGITNDDWFRIGGGDGFYVQVDPTDAEVLYVESQGGFLSRLELRTGERKFIRPEAGPGEKPFRFDWNSPILISPHNHRTIYFGGNRVFRSTDRGDSWAVGPDLTRDQDRDRMQIMGAEPGKDMLSRHDGQETFGQVVTLHESPIKQGLLYAGTDDGNLQVSRDGGRNWKNVAGKIKGVPEGTYVSRVTASQHAEGTAYATFDGHRSNDYNTYVFVTTDYGETWSSLKSDLPAGATARVIREHHRNPNLLFLGTEFGAFVSLDRGAHWARLKGNLPPVRVDDIQIHRRDNDLVLATHGRSIWVLDNITALEQMSDAVMRSDVYLFDLRPATHFRLYGRKGNTGHKYFSAPNPPYGAIISYYLKAKPEGEVKVTILDKSGRVIHEVPGAKDAGLNRIVWDLRYGLPPAAQPAPQGQAGGGGFGTRGPRVEPGEYVVRVSAAGKESSKPLRVEEDPRIQIGDGDRAAWRDASMKVFELQRAAEMTRRSMQNVKTQLASAQEALKKNPGASQALAADARALTERTEAVQRKLVPVLDLSGRAGPPLPGAPRPLLGRINQLASLLDGYTSAPSQDQRESIGELSKEMKSIADEWNKLMEEAVPGFNKRIKEGEIKPLDPGPRLVIPD